MKKQRGQPLILLEVEDRNLLDRLLTQTSKIADFVAGHRRMFVYLGRWDDSTADWVRTDRDTATIPRAALLKNIINTRKALEKADTMLAEWQESIKSL